MAAWITALAAVLVALALWNVSGAVHELHRALTELHRALIAASDLQTKSLHRLRRSLARPRVDADAEEVRREREERRHLEDLMGPASRWATYHLHSDYLSGLAWERWNELYPLWRIRYPRAALALDEQERKAEEYAATISTMEHEERQRLKETDWLERHQAWEERFPDAARAYDELRADAYSEYYRFRAVAEMPEIVEARNRDAKPSPESPSESSPSP